MKWCQLVVELYSIHLLICFESLAFFYHHYLNMLYVAFKSFIYCKLSIRSLNWSKYDGMNRWEDYKNEPMRKKKHENIISNSNMISSCDMMHFKETTKWRKSNSMLTDRIKHAQCIWLKFSLHVPSLSSPPLPISLFLNDLTKEHFVESLYAWEFRQDFSFRVFIHVHCLYFLTISFPSMRILFPTRVNSTDYMNPTGYFWG